MLAADMSHLVRKVPPGGIARPNHRPGLRPAALGCRENSLRPANVTAVASFGAGSADDWLSSRVTTCTVNNSVQGAFQLSGNRPPECRSPAAGGGLCCRP